MLELVVNFALGHPGVAVACYVLSFSAVVVGVLKLCERGKK